MGLTIHYSFQSRATSPLQARRLVEELHKWALDVGFQFVGDLVELQGEERDYRKRGSGDPLKWLLIQSEAFAQHPLVRERRSGFVTPAHLIAFSTKAGKASESADFGLCRYPAEIEVRQNDGSLK